MNEAMQKDTPLTYDATSVFVNNFEKILNSTLISTKLLYSDYTVYRTLTLSPNNDDSPSNRSSFQSNIAVNLGNTTMEEICDTFNYSQVSNRNIFNSDGHIDSETIETIDILDVSADYRYINSFLVFFTSETSAISSLFLYETGG